jgi:hypothetical protein
MSFITSDYKMEDEKYVKVLGRVKSIDVTDSNGILTISMDFDFGGSGQAIHQVFDMPVKDSKGDFISRVGGMFGTELLRLLIRGFCVDELQRIKGKTALVLYRKQADGKIHEYIDGIEIPKNLRSDWVKTNFVIDMETVGEYCRKLDQMAPDEEGRYQMSEADKEYFKRVIRYD